MLHHFQQEILLAFISLNRAVRKADAPKSCDLQQFLNSAT